MSVLSLTSVGVQFGADKPAADGVTLDVQRGEIFGIVGESGSGKSTLANAVMGLLPANANVTGSITVNGREILGLVRKRPAPDARQRGRDDLSGRLRQP